MFDEHYHHEQNMIESICSPSGHISSESHRPSGGCVVSKELHLHIKASAKPLKRTGKKSVMRVKQRPAILRDHVYYNNKWRKCSSSFLKARTNMKTENMKYSEALIE